MSEPTIDACCGGERPQEEVQGEHSLTLDALLAPPASAGAPTLPTPWDAAPLPALIDHVLLAYHRPLWRALPRLEALARSVCYGHERSHGAQLDRVLHVFLALKSLLERHMAREEDLLFPRIRRGEGALPLEPMLRDHEEIFTYLGQLREITQGYAIPREACAAWAALGAGLAAMDGSLRRHIRLENDVLFPRAEAA